MILSIIFVVVVIVIEIIFQPRFDITEYDDLILWYGRGKNRKFMYIF